MPRTMATNVECAAVTTVGRHDDHASKRTTGHRQEVLLDGDSCGGPDMTA